MRPALLSTCAPFSSRRTDLNSNRPTAKLLQPLLTAPKSGEKIAVEILTRGKDEAENKKLFERIIELIGEGVSAATAFSLLRRSC